MLTLATAASAETVIRHSRFLAHAAPVDSQAATLAFYEEVADPEATHNCWAWKLDAGYRCSDDGEPSGTAGKPILAAIEGRNLNRVMVVVTRYFGGIKLGVGGLLRAYSAAAARCLEQGRIIELHPVQRCEVTAGFEWTGQLHAALLACEARKLAEDHQPQGVAIRFEVRSDRLRRLQDLLRDGTRGTAKLRCG